MSARHTLDLLGEALRDLAPLVAAAVQALDKPGTRALRRKIDDKFHFAVIVYGVLRREDEPDCDWDRMVLPHYDRAVPIWPGRLAPEARKDRGATAEGATPACGHILRLVVDNGRPVEHVTLGGAA